MFLYPQVLLHFKGETQGSCQAAVATDDGHEAQEGWSECSNLGSGRMAETGQRGDGAVVDECQLE